MNKFNAVGGLMIVSGVVTIKRGMDRAKTEDKLGETSNSKWLKETLIDCGLGFAGAVTSAIGLFILCADVTASTN